MPHDTVPLPDRRSAELAALLAGLDPLLQVSVVLVYVDGRSIREAAQILAVPPAAVTTALAAAFRRIGRTLVAP